MDSSIPPTSVWFARVQDRSTPPSMESRCDVFHRTANARVPYLSIPNVALFGQPVRDGILRVAGINRVGLRRVVYDIHFGRGLSGSS